MLRYINLAKMQCKPVGRDHVQWLHRYGVFHGMSYPNALIFGDVS